MEKDTIIFWLCYLLCSVFCAAKQHQCDIANNATTGNRQVNTMLALLGGPFFLIGAIWRQMIWETWK